MTEDRCTDGIDLGAMLGVTGERPPQPKTPGRREKPVVMTPAMIRLSRNGATWIKRRGYNEIPDYDEA